MFEGIKALNFLTVVRLFRQKERICQKGILANQKEEMGISSEGETI
jgi:hypothetical protein